MMAEIDASGLRQSVGEDAVEPRFGARTGDLELRHRRHFDETDGGAHGMDFFADIFDFLGPAPAVLSFASTPSGANQLAFPSH